jgi:hypothetical protein
MQNARNLGPASDRRAVERVPTKLRGMLFVDGAECQIADYSPRGARLSFAGEPPAGPRFILIIWATGAGFTAIERWRTASEIGVQFEKRLDLRGKVPAHLAAIKAKWLARRPKLNRWKLKECGAIAGHRGAPRQVRLS